MLESVQRFIGDVLGYGASDPRKAEYGTLDDIKLNRDTGYGRADRTRLRRRRAVAGNGVDTKINKQRAKSKDRVRKPSTTRREPGKMRKLLHSLKNVFSTEEQDLDLMQRACGNTNAMLPASARKGPRSGPEERRKLRDRIVRSDAFKRKLLEIKYDDHMLEQLRRGRSKSRGASAVTEPLEEDRVLLLQKQLQEMRAKLQGTEKELQITQKKLKFAQEKNTLLESLLDDANIDSEYVKSRRDIKNLQRENLKPDAELPPSPRRSVNPLFTSSPVRNPSSAVHHEQEASKNFYSKYPKIPETESLVQGRSRTSLSPIRIDYSKYSA